MHGCAKRKKKSKEHTLDTAGVVRDDPLLREERESQQGSRLED
jgi:hypothetical protein